MARRVDVGNHFGNLYPSRYMDSTGPMAAACEVCGRCGHIYHAIYYPFGLVIVDGWQFVAGVWQVENPRCRDKTACRSRLNAES